MNKSQISELHELPKYSKEKWLENIEKSLKNKDLEDLYLVKEGLNIDPFPSDDGESYKPLKRNQQEWIIGVVCGLKGPESLNNEILYYLENGVEAIRVNEISNADWNQILNKVHTDFIYVDVSDEITNTPVHIKKGAVQTFNQNDSIHTCSLSSKSDSVIDELSNIFKAVISKLVRKTIDPSQIRIETTVNSYMPISISKLRAIRILWLNILKYYEYDLKPVFLTVHGNAQSADQNHALIELSTMGVNAVLGGCDLLYLNGQKFDSNQRRLTINIQHMLKMESKLHLYDDPLAGSYAIENLTNQICEKVWSNITSK